VKGGLCRARLGAQAGAWSAALVLAILAGHPSVAADLKTDRAGRVLPDSGLACDQRLGTGTPRLRVRTGTAPGAGPAPPPGPGIDEAELNADEQASSGRGRLFMVDHEGGRTLTSAIRATGVTGRLCSGLRKPVGT